MNMPFIQRTICGLSLFFMSVVSADLAAQDLKSTAQATVQKHQKAVVTVKLVIKMRMQQQEQEQKLEVTGTVIDPSGLTVVSANTIDPLAALKGVLSAMGPGAANLNLSSDVTETKLVMDDGSEVDADVVLKDVDLDLAFIRPKDTSKPFAFITLTSGKAPQLLDQVFTVNRLGRTENRSIALNEGRVRSIVKGPRTYYVCDSVIGAQSLGCAVFAADGSTLGVFVTKPSEDMGQGSMANAMMSMSMSGKTPTMPSPVLRPVEDVLEIANQAKQAKAPEKKVEPKEAAPAKSDAPKTETPPAGSGK
jgi:S1-C subfamily serine protease